MRNCPNCGAPLEPYKCRCEFCGTWYFDFSAFDMSGSDPYYVKFRTPYGIITTLARPELKTIEVQDDWTEAMDDRGNILIRFANYRTCDLDVTFHSVVSPEDGSLYRLEIDNEAVDKR